MRHYTTTTARPDAPVPIPTESGDWVLVGSPTPIGDGRLVYTWQSRDDGAPATGKQKLLEKPGA
jgi:hypothetical protein